MNWAVRTLGEVADVSAGNSAPQEKHLFDNGRYPFFRTSDVGRVHIGVVEDALDKLNDAGIKSLSLFPKGTILVPKSGASTFVNHRVMLGRDGYVSSHLATVNAKPDLANQKFLFYYLLTVDARSLSVDSQYPTLKVSDLQLLSTPLPKLPEQQRIVGKLDAAFAALAEAQAHVERNRANARELFESYLNGVFEGKGDGWIENTLGEMCTIRSGTTLPPGVEKPSGELAYLKVADMSVAGNERHVTTSSRFVDRASVKTAMIFPVGTTIFPKRGGAILTNKKRLTSVDIVADLNIMGLTPQKGLLPEFLFHYFLRLDLREINNGSSIPQINNYSIEPLLINYPASLKEQRRIVDKLEEVFQETNQLETTYAQKLTELEGLKKAVLGAAFGGEL